jgi:hypothetical protein
LRLNIFSSFGCGFAALGLCGEYLPRQTQKVHTIESFQAAEQREDKKLPAIDYGCENRVGSAHLWEDFPVPASSYVFTGG